MFVFGLEENFFKSPDEMSDDELRREYVALFRADSEIMPDVRVSEFWKYQLTEHAKLVLDEYQNRNAEAIIAPFENFGII